MERLAERGRITSRMTRDDPMVHRLHNVGVRLPLPGGERLGPPMTWSLTDVWAQLLKRTIQLCTLSRNLGSRNLGSYDRLPGLAEEVLDPGMSPTRWRSACWDSSTRRPGPAGSPTGRPGRR